MISEKNLCMYNLFSKSDLIC